MAEQILTNDHFGLDEDARNAAISAAQAAASADIPPLDPNFPYLAEPFNARFFALDQNPTFLPASPSH